MGRISPQLYDIDPRPLLKDDIAFFLRRVGPSDKVLDIGVGTGRLAIALANNGREVHGIDSDPSMLSQVIYNIASGALKHADNFSLERVNLLSYENRDSKFDSAIFGYRTFATFLSKKSQTLALKKAIESVRGGGSIWVTLPAEFETPSKSWEGNHTVDWTIDKDSGWALSRKTERIHMDVENKIHFINLKYVYSQQSGNLVEINEELKVAHITHQEFINMCSTIGVKIVNIFGSYCEKPIGEGPEMIYQLVKL